MVGNTKEPRFDTTTPYIDGHYYHSGGQIVRCRADDPVLKVLQGYLRPGDCDHNGVAHKQPGRELRDKLRTDGKKTPARDDTASQGRSSRGR